MNVLMVMHLFPPEFGGGTLQGIELAKALSRRGVNVEFLTDNGSQRTIVDRYQGLRVTRLRTFLSQSSKLRELLYSLKIFLFILTHSKYTIIHFHSIMGFELLFFPLLSALGRKVIIKLTLAGSDDPLAFKNRRKISFLYMWGLKYVDEFIAISTLLKQNTLKAGIPADKVEQIFNGVNTEKFRKLNTEKKQNLKECLGYKHFSRLFLSVGSIEHRKGYDTLLEAWRLINDSQDSCVLLIIGPGNTKNNQIFLDLSRKIEEYKFNNVFFVGGVDNVDDYMKIADCFVFCSRMEGLPNVLIEALAAELPVVSMNIPGITEDIIQDRNLGRICCSRNPEEFASIVLSFLNEYSPAKAKSAAKNIRETFSIENISEQYIRLYRRLCNDTPNTY